MFIVVHRPAHTLSDIVKLHQEGGGSVYGRIVGTFFQPVRRMAMMIDMWMYTSNIGAIFSVTILPSKD